MKISHLMWMMRRKGGEGPKIPSLSSASEMLSGKKKRAEGVVQWHSTPGFDPQNHPYIAAAAAAAAASRGRHRKRGKGYPSTHSNRVQEGQSANTRGTNSRVLENMPGSQQSGCW